MLGANNNTHCLEMSNNLFDIKKSIKTTDYTFIALSPLEKPRLSPFFSRHTLHNEYNEESFVISSITFCLKWTDLLPCLSADVNLAVEISSNNNILSRKWG